MRSLALIFFSLLVLPGCFISLDFDKFDDDDERDERDDTGAPSEQDDTDADPVEDSEVAPSGPAVTVVVSPDTVAPGETTFLDVVISGDAGADLLVDLGFSEGVEVLDWRVLSGDTVLVAVDVAVDASGLIDLDLDFGDVGSAQIEDVLQVEVSAGAPGCADGGGGDDCE